VFVASNEAAQGCTIKPQGGNIFAAVWYDNDRLASSSAMVHVGLCVHEVFITNNRCLFGDLSLAH